MIYVDSELAPQSGGGGDRRASRTTDGQHPIYRQLSEALADYQQDWGGLPQIEISDGPPLRTGSTASLEMTLRQSTSGKPALMPRTITST